MYRSVLTMTASRGPRHRTAGSKVALGLLALLVTVGCSSSKMVTLRSVPKSPLVEQLKLTARAGPQPSPRTMQLLRVYDLTDDAKGDPRQLLDKLQAIIDREPSIDKIHASAELSFLAAKKEELRNPQLALDLYGASVLHAYEYLFDDRFIGQRNPYDPQFRGACDLYNGALESALRLIHKHGGLKPGQTHTIETATGNWDITCTLRGGRWRVEDFDHFEFVSDYEINGLRNHYQTYGLGVPLIAVRQRYAGEPPAAKYYPPNLGFPVTAFLRPVGGPSRPSRDGSTRRGAVLELYDPLTTSHLAISNAKVSLEGDVTTPLAYFLSDPTFNSLATIGLLRPEMLLQMRPGQQDPIMGLYMVQPYEPDKIPVLLVHGLWSSPMTWMEVFNDLRSTPEIREHYQFWFYLYPTGQPFWISAAQLRRDLAGARRVLDPNGEEPALDQMVLIGHSMGGLISRLQTIHSSNDYWNIVSKQPFHLVKAKPEVRERIRSCFFFEPNPSVRRVITVGTPHRGSKVSNNVTQWITSKLITLPKMIARSQQRLFQDNKSLFHDTRLLEIETGVDSLAPDSPIFPVMLASRRPPWVKYHNIVGLVPEQGLFGSLAAGTDGVVSFESAHMGDVESELVVPADHVSVHSHPRAVLEVRRILLEHLAELRSFPGTVPPRMRTAQPPPEHRPASPTSDVF